MQKYPYKKSRRRIDSPKCEGECVVYTRSEILGKLQEAVVRMLDIDPNIRSFQCHVLLEGLACGKYTSDIVYTTVDGETGVMECFSTTQLKKRESAVLMDESRNYWLRRGVTDWTLVINDEQAADSVARNSTADGRATHKEDTQS